MNWYAWPTGQNVKLAVLAALRPCRRDNGRATPDATREWIVSTLNARNLDYLGHLARESALFGHAADGAAPDARVPSCPDWTADDLRSEEHTSELQSQFHLV